MVLVPADHEVHAVRVEQRQPLLPDPEVGAIELLAVEIATWCMHTTTQSTSRLERAAFSSASSHAFCRPWEYPRT